ncbi:MAG: bifunctional folylpolyglutamate synthase/dihydrofolate synthase [Devosiaceae bacterium]|nr:bifunctional folylpolyglutamate synthase/dihydrofolate synthase [Devosiaceae bacterium]
MRTDAILKRLLELHPNKLIDLKLNRIERLLELLGRPQDNLPKTIHVAGTNGKGSTIAHLSAMLEAANKKVHVYSSPHLVSFRERIRLAGKLVSAKRLNKALEHCEKINAGAPITYFEITTAAAFYLFSKISADYLLLEVGLGGRFDATNVIDEPFGTIITPVSIDHVEFLGNNLTKIAHEKAGIIKKNVTLVIGRQSEEAQNSIIKYANSLSVTPFVQGQDYDGFKQNGRLIYQDEKGLLDLPSSALRGDFQYENAALAIAAIRHFELPISEHEIAIGLKNTQWAGRLMAIKQGELYDILPKTHELWLDGGHNIAGAKVLAQALWPVSMSAKNGGASTSKESKTSNRKRINGGGVGDGSKATNGDKHKRADKNKKPLVLIIGSYANKDVAGFLGKFEGIVSQVITIPIGGDRASISAKDLAKIAIKQGFNAKPERSIKAALKSAAKIKNARVLICGSLHLVGDFLAKNKTILN